MVKDSGFHRSIPVSSCGQSARAASRQAGLRNSCASERPWRSRSGQRPEVASTARSISLEGIGFVLRSAPHRELSHDDATQVAFGTQNVRFQVSRLRSSDRSIRRPRSPADMASGGHETLEARQCGPCERVRARAREAAHRYQLPYQLRRQLPHQLPRPALCRHGHRARRSPAK